MPSFQFEWTINVGHLMNFAVIASGIISLYFSIRSDIRNMGTRLQPVEDGMKRIVELMEVVARQDERLKAMDRRLEEKQGRR